MIAIMKTQKSFAIWALVIFFMAITIVAAGKAPINKRSLIVMGGGGDEPSEQKPRPNKRTFCNAFTGCGRKRSDGSMPTKDDEYDHDATAENSDDTVDDMARDILAEARLWEALQARNSMRYPSLQRQGFFGRQKRSVGEDGGYLSEMKMKTERNSQLLP